MINVPYQVVYQFVGFLSPINIPGYTQSCDQPCLVSTVNGNSTLPVKFQLKDANGQLVQPSSLPVWLMPQRGGAITAPLDASAFSAQPPSGASFKQNGNHYAYNWKTTGFTPGYYWRIGVTLDDGQTYYVIIRLR